MDEDSVLDVAIQFLSKDDWHLAYRTRRVSQSAIPGVDAILCKTVLKEFRLIDAKGESRNPEQRSAAFVNCLGSLVKRIHINSGYLHLEAKALFTPPDGYTSKAFRTFMREHAIHRNCEYWLAFPDTMRQTIIDTLDPALAGILRIYILLVDPDGNPTRFVW